MGIKTIFKLSCLFFLVCCISSFSFALDTNKDIILDKNEGDSPSIILKNQEDGAGLIKKVKGTNSLDIKSLDGPVNLKSKDDNNFISIENILSNVVLYFNNETNKNTYGLRLNKDNNVLEFKDSRNTSWQRLYSQEDSYPNTPFWKIKVKNTDFNVSKDDSGTFYIIKDGLVANLPKISEIEPNFIISLKRKGNNDFLIIPSSKDLVEGKDRVKLKSLGSHITLITDGISWYELYKSGNVSFYTVSDLCPENYISIPPNPDYGILNSFCVAKYEMKNVNGVATSQMNKEPWVNISFKEAKSACENLGEGYHLITNNEWMTVVRNMELVRDNWENGNIGASRINRGHLVDGNCYESGVNAVGEPQYPSPTEDISPWTLNRRTHVLSTGDVIWDMAGNVFELIDWPNLENIEVATPNGEINKTTETNDMPQKSYWPSLINLTHSKNSIGSYRSFGNHNLAIRGGGFCPAFGTPPGLFSLSLSNYESNATLPYYTGFRCSYSNGG